MFCRKVLTVALRMCGWRNINDLQQFTALQGNHFINFTGSEISIGVDFAVRPDAGCWRTVPCTLWPGSWFDSCVRITG